MPLRIRHRIASIFPLGIAARLTLSFIAVAVLAATANFIARETVAVIYLPPHETPPPAPVVTPKRATHETLLSALAALDDATQQRLESNTKLAESNFEKAADELKGAHAVNVVRLHQYGQEIACQAGGQCLHRNEIQEPV